MFIFNWRAGLQWPDCANNGRQEQPESQLLDLLCCSWEPLGTAPQPTHCHDSVEGLKHPLKISDLLDGRECLTTFKHSS